LVPKDAQQAIGHGVRAKRSKSGPSALTCSAPENAVQRPRELVAPLVAALAKAPGRTGETAKALVATIISDAAREQMFPMRRFRRRLDVVRKSHGQR
jgi:hypothetical protein